MIIGPRQLLDFTIENRIKGIVIWITTVQKFKVHGSMCTPENLDALCGFADVGDFQRAHRQWVGEILREGRTVRDDLEDTHPSVNNASDLDPLLTDGESPWCFLAAVTGVALDCELHKVGASKRLYRLMASSSSGHAICDGIVSYR